MIFNEVCINEDLLPTYTNINTHDPAARNKAFTKEYRRKLVFDQIETKKEAIRELSGKLVRLKEEFSGFEMEPDIRNGISEHFNTITDNCKHVNQLKITKKLSRAYGGTILLPERKDGYINLSSVELTDSQKELLNLGLKCHFMSSSDHMEKKAAIETLYQDILKLEKDNKVTVNSRLRDSLIGESSKMRGNSKSKIISRRLREAAKQLREDDRIVIRRADKSSVFVIMDRHDYIDKINALLEDESKFERIKKDPTNQVKAKVNRIITSANAVIGDIHFQKISGEFSPGYAYGNVKVHKAGNPLRPIISQVPTATYKLAKRLNGLLLPYLPAKYCLKSVDEFVDILRNRQVSGVLASLDVESLFTNVPVKETIKLILDNVYSGENLPPLNLSRGILEKLLLACTTEAPFRGPDGRLYRQKDGIAMGSPLGPLFANFYMCNLENSVLQDDSLRPSIYCRYVDDIFIDVRDVTQLEELKAAMEQKSVLKFTHEISTDNCIPFLDVFVKTDENGAISTSVYRKATDGGHCLNACSECPMRYKVSVVRAFVRRATHHCSSWIETDAELARVKQILVNNGYPNHMVDTEIRQHLEKQNKSSHQSNSHLQDSIVLYYKNQMSSAYRVDERVMQNIIHDNVKPVNGEKQIKLVIYYRSQKVQNLVMRNNMTRCKDDLKRTNVIYQFTCPSEDCRSLHSGNYIGCTSTTLSRRLTMHLQDGAPKSHMREKHDSNITRKQLVENTKILKSCSDQRQLTILEALFIREYSPALNRQLKSCITLGLWS